MQSLAFTMSGQPRGKGRPRLSTRGGFARAYTDPKTRTYEASVRALALKAMGEHAPFTGPLSVSLRFRLEPPKSMSKRERAAVLAGEQPYLGRLDVDNCAKAVLDGMNGVAFADDVQIVRLFVIKVADAKPGVDVTIQAFQPQDAPA